MFFSNAHCVSTMMDKYGIVPHRTDCDKLLSSIPKEFSRDFIRGILDADGSFCHYVIQERGYSCNKYSISFLGIPMLLRYIEQNFINEGIVTPIERKLLKRHKEENRDGQCRYISFTGKNQTIKILKYLYADASRYLDRKYQKYLEIIK